MSQVVFIPLDIGHLPVRRDWQAAALCAQTDPEAFFPDRGGGTLAPKRVCEGCEVRLDCLNDALNTGDPYGIRGGYAERERRKMRRQRRRPPFDAPRPRRGNRKERAA
jgi:WhiB family redox-sensing transcriptional regulator